MHLSEFQHSALEIANPALTSRDRMNNAALGLAGESGEFADHVKKILFQGLELDDDARAKLAEELGDVLMYVAYGCTAIGTNMNDVARNVLAKLRVRYPDGYRPRLARPVALRSPALKVKTNLLEQREARDA